ncbi:hypothetical protein [Methanoregula sp.]|jgi:hypothetical protein|uniref:hypothetical protein n=1 Tax=Methanoregula sp. TaxID=2052170 RepID=UPI00262D0ED3|nr:hypothetical protein [Methanoregula sp.]MDD5143502.1 hypothetical protein [Methanoregula sp.]HPK53855.1 hypothetical protein [Smithellaceae bacterium]
MPKNTTTPVINPATDIPLFVVPRFSYYTGNTVRSGTDIFVSAIKDRPAAFFLLHWTDIKNDCIPLPEACAIRLIKILAAKLDTERGVQYANLAKYVPAFYERSEELKDTMFMSENDVCREYVSYFRQEPEIT